MDPLTVMDKAHKLFNEILEDAGGDIHVAALALAGMVVAYQRGFSPGFSRCHTMTPSREQP